MAGKQKWTEAKIRKMVAEGYGDGFLTDYKPWIEVADVSSLGNSRRVWSAKTLRTHHLLSNVEFNLFRALEWQQNIIDIREQFPLDRALTQDIARSLGIRHPHYPGTRVPTVMTVDFMVTLRVEGEHHLVAYNAKRDEEAEDERSVLKLEIQRTYFEQLGFPHHAIYHSQIPVNNIANIGDIREAPLKPGELEPRPGFFTGLMSRMVHHMPNANPNASLVAYCQDFDGSYGVASGTGIRVARMLMNERVLVPDLSAPDLGALPLSAFLMTAQLGQLRAAGGI